ncbi:hypothetical protein SD70_32485 [Gordoniibacillus kamchatkensis]|uniref:Uncharacterized protein n=1 Tax=Gordoniibacillus kamchatkensis TaxID=1590651 RepID=A0ABR5A0U4_9BACL|nr:hypothetical protein SD70_32485 [Paenibacillus sp. VKM B-2647]
MWALLEPHIFNPQRSRTFSGSWKTSRYFVLILLFLILLQENLWLISPFPGIFAGSRHFRWSFLLGPLIKLESKPPIN